MTTGDYDEWGGTDPLAAERERRVRPEAESRRAAPPPPPAPGAYRAGPPEPGPRHGALTDPGPAAANVPPPPPPPGAQAPPPPVAPPPVDPAAGNGPGPGPGAGPGTGPGPVEQHPPPGAPHPGISYATDPFLDPVSRDHLTERLHHALTRFVDSPHEAIQEADRVYEEAARHITDALAHRRATLHAFLQGQYTGTETEELRLALRQYREATERLLAM